MSNTLSLQMQQKPSQHIKQLQRLIMSRQMQQAIHILEKPVMELTPLIDSELEQNPILEYSGEEDGDGDSEWEELLEENQETSLDADAAPEKELIFEEGDFEVLKRLDEDFRDDFSESGIMHGGSASDREKLQAFLESSIVAQETLFDHLMKQAQEAFENFKQRDIAEVIIGSLDESGFLKVSLEELSVLKACPIDAVTAVLKVIQRFDPPGIAAQTLKESLLIQLASQGKQHALSYAIIDRYFDDLLHNHIPLIKKNLHCTAEQIAAAVDGDIAKLDLHPGAQLSCREASPIVPDVSLRQEEDKLIPSVNEDPIPRFRLNRRYLRMLDDPSLALETKEFIKQKIISAKWLFRNMAQRNTILERIAEVLSRKQRAFFLEPEGQLVPLTMKSVAEELSVHESTVARAVSGKYIHTPRGMLPLRSFFTSSLSTVKGPDVSARTAKDLLEEMIVKEDLQHPLSDEALSKMLKEKGIRCARRTVAKYRAQLNIGTAYQRRKF